MITARSLRSDKRRREHHLWQHWMTEAAGLAHRFYMEAGEDDPFAYNETASVGFLSTAATKAGFISLPEFAVYKVNVRDGRKRSRGRADLWVQAEPKLEWSFEFKQHFTGRGSDADLRRMWANAVTCAKQARINGVCVAGGIISFAWLKREKPQNLQAARDAVWRFASDRQFGWLIGAENNGPETYIFLEIIA